MITAVTRKDIRIVVTVPRFARSSFFAPIFWLTKVVAAMVMLCIGSVMKVSSLL